MMSFGRLWLPILFLMMTLGCIVNSVPLCEDKTKSCKKWAKKSLCTEIPKYKKQRFYVSMAKLCKKSCEMCGDDDYSLFDQDSRCNSYAAKGYCEMRPHQGFMLKRCKYSCRRTIRNGITSPGRGNFERKYSNKQQPQQQGNWNQQYQSDSRYSQQYGQQYGQQYSQQYAQQLGQQYPQQYSQQTGQQYPQQYSQQTGQQYPQQYTQQTDQQYPQQNNAQQNAQQYAQGLSSVAMPAQSQGLSQSQSQVQMQSGNGAIATRKHKLEQKSKHKS